MAVPGSLKDLEEQSAGNADDSSNPGDDYYKKSADNDQKDPGTEVDSHGDTVQKNWNADRENLEDGEKKPDSLYKQASEVEKALANGFRGNLKGVTSRLGPSGGIVFILLFGIIGLGGGSSFLASSLLINIKEMFHNDRSDGSRTNRLFSRAAISNKFGGEGKCKKLIPICIKATTMSTKQVADWEANGFVVKGKIIGEDGKETGKRVGETDRDGKPYPTLVTNGQSVLVDEVIYPDGRSVKNGKDLYAHADNKPNMLRRLEGAFATKASFYTNKFFDSVLGKWKFSKGAQKFPAPDDSNDDPNNQRPDENNQDKTFNQEADTVHVNPGTGARDPNNPLSSRSEEIIGDVDSRGTKAREQIANKGGAVGNIVQGICTAYQLGHLAETAVKAYHAYQLVRFGLLFFQAADQIKYGKGDQDRVTYLSNNLTYFENNKIAADGKKNEKFNLSATDAEGYQIALDKDSNGLKAFSQKFLLGGSIGQKIAKFTGAFEDGFDKIPGTSQVGDNKREKMKNACRSASSDTGAILTACIGLMGAGTATTGPIGLSIGAASCACTAEGIVTSKIPLWDKVPAIIRTTLPVLGSCESVKEASKKAMDGLIAIAKSRWVREWVMDVLSEIHVDDNTKGVDAGNAIAAGAGLMLSTAATGYGLQPSSSANNHSDVAEYIAYTEPLEQTYIALEKDDARQDPLNIDNKYSLVGTLARSLKTDNLEAAQSSAFGLFSTLGSLFNNSFNILTGTQTVDALYSQPSTLSDTKSKRLKSCTDNDLESIGATGDTFCSIVAITSKQELQAANDQAYIANNQNIVNLIDYMTNRQEDPEGVDGATSGGTFCETSAITDGPSATCGDASKEPSIGEDGTPTAGSQYEQFLKYCTDKREAAWGAQFEPYNQGSQRDQEWYSGRQCLKDTNMMRNFRMWTNYCLQIGTMNGTLNCYSKDVSKPTTSGGDWVVPAEAICTSPYGDRGGRLHAGIDLANDIGTPVVAPTDITITHVGNEAGGYGNVIVAKADDGSDYVFRFGHLDGLNNRKAGDKVAKGELIAPMGNSGGSTGPHLHFEIYNAGTGTNPYASSGAPSNDPVKILAEHGVTVSCE